MADEQVKAEETEKKDPEREAAQAKADATNAGRSGVGTRIKVLRTRGKGSLVVSCEVFDESKPETLPKDVQEFLSVTGADEKAMLNYLIQGYNAVSEDAASDPLSEFVNPTWPPDAQNLFRITVRNYSRGIGISLDEAVNLIKPGFDKKYATA